MQLKLRDLEVQTNALEERLNRDLLIQGQRLEVIDSSTKSALVKHSEKYQAACELGTRTLLLEKAVKWLLEVGVGRPSDATILPPTAPSVSRSVSSERRLPGAAESVSLPPQFKLQRMYSTGAPQSVVLRSPRRNEAPLAPHVFRSQSQPLQTVPQLSLQSSLRPVPTEVGPQGLAKIMHRTLGEPGALERGMLTKLWQNESQVLMPLLKALQPPQAQAAQAVPRVASPTVVPRDSSQATEMVSAVPGRQSAPTPPRYRLPSSPSRHTRRVSPPQSYQPPPQLQPQPKPLRQHGRKPASGPRQPQQKLTRASATSRRSNPLSQLPGTNPGLSASYASGGGGGGSSVSIGSPRRTSEATSPRDVIVPRSSSGGGSPRGAYHWITPRNSGPQQDTGGTRGRLRC